MENEGVRLVAAGYGVKLWELADALGISEATITRKLRKPLTEDEKAAVLAAIKKVRDSRTEN